MTKLGVITTPPEGQVAQGEQHPGIDIANVKGTPIPAFKEGVVVRSENGHQQGEPNGGNVVWVRDPQGNIHQYNHLNRTLVRPGQRVAADQQIGEMGNSGNSVSKSGLGDGVHLDYRITNAYNKYKSPMMYMKKYL